MPQINYPHLASLVFNTPLMATPNLLNNVQQALIPRLTSSSQVSFDLASATQEVIVNNSPDRTYLKTQAGIAIIPVQGILSTRGSGVDANCNLILSYEMLDAKLQAALNSDQVEHIVLDIDSNGGAAVGCFDFAARIYQARAIKPITAIVNYSAYSAAYMIASAASEIVLSTTSGVGSIGVIATHMDISKAAESQGVKFTTVFRGAHKNDLTPFEPISDQSMAFLNQQVEELYQLLFSQLIKLGVD
jgi:signal peptide peptidase SppA